MKRHIITLILGLVIVGAGIMMSSDSGTLAKAFATKRDTVAIVGYGALVFGGVLSVITGGNLLISFLIAVIKLPFRAIGWLLNKVLSARSEKKATKTSKKSATDAQPIVEPAKKSSSGAVSNVLRASVFARLAGFRRTRLSNVEFTTESTLTMFSWAVISGIAVGIIEHWWVALVAAFVVFAFQVIKEEVYGGEIYYVETYDEYFVVYIEIAARVIFIAIVVAVISVHLGIVRAVLLVLAALYLFQREWLSWFHILAFNNLEKSSERLHEVMWGFLGFVPFAGISIGLYLIMSGLLKGRFDLSAGEIGVISLVLLGVWIWRVRARKITSPSAIPIPDADHPTASDTAKKPLQDDVPAKVTRPDVKPDPVVDTPVPPPPPVASTDPDAPFRPKNKPVMPGIPKSHPIMRVPAAVRAEFAKIRLGEAQAQALYDAGITSLSEIAFADEGRLLGILDQTGMFTHRWEEDWDVLDTIITEALHLSSVRQSPNGGAVKGQNGSVPPAKKQTPKSDDFTQLKGIKKVRADLLKSLGYDTFGSLAEADNHILASQLRPMSRTSVASLQAEAEKLAGGQKAQRPPAQVGDKGQRKGGKTKARKKLWLTDIEGVDTDTARKLVDAGFGSLPDLAKADPDAVIIAIGATGVRQAREIVTEWIEKAKAM